MSGGKPTPPQVVPAGPINALQWNKDGAIFGGSGTLAYDPTADTLTAPKTLIRHNSTLGGDIEKSLELALSWNPSTAGGDFNGISMQLTSISPTNRSALKGIDLYIEDGGTGVLSENTGIRLVTQTKARHQVGVRSDIHGNFGVPADIQNAGWFTANPPSKAVLGYGVAVTAELRGGVGSVVNGGHAIDAICDLSTGGTFGEAANVYAILEASSVGRTENFTGFRLQGTDRSSGMTFGTVIGADFGDVTLGDILNRSIRTRRGPVEFGDRLLLAVPAAAIPDEALVPGQFTFDLDEANGRFLIKAKLSNGAVKTFAVN